MDDFIERKKLEFLKSKFCFEDTDGRDKYYSLRTNYNTTGEVLEFLSQALREQREEFVKKINRCMKYNTFEPIESLAGKLVEIEQYINTLSQKEDGKEKE